MTLEEPYAGQPSDESPAVLYHYTSSAGLLGILTSGSMWATDLAYLNDRREMRYGLELIRTAILELDDGRWSEADADTLLGLRDLPPRLRAMVACFCEDGDRLGQWRGYGRNAGCSIGVDVRALEQHWGRVGGPALPFWAVVYDVDMCRAFARAAATDLMAAYDQLLASFDRLRATGGESTGRALYAFHQEHGTRANLAAACVKDPAFAEEREWRLLRGIHEPPHDAPDGIQYRDGPLGLTPYVSLDLRDDTGRIPIREITVGPGENADLRVDAARLLLLSVGYNADDVEVRASNVPYRP